MARHGQRGDSPKRHRPAKDPKDNQLPRRSQAAARGLVDQFEAQELWSFLEENEENGQRCERDFEFRKLANLTMKETLRRLFPLGSFRPSLELAGHCGPEAQEALLQPRTLVARQGLVRALSLDDRAQQRGRPLGRCYSTR